MGKIKNKISFILVLAICITTVFVNISIAKAGSYPVVIFYSDENFTSSVYYTSATVGDTYSIRMLWFPEFKNERYTLSVTEDLTGKEVATHSANITNLDSSSKKIIVTWDTTGCNAGSYTVTVNKEFYSYYRWNETPTPSTLYITLDAKSNSSSVSDNSSDDSQETASDSDESVEKITGITAKNKKGRKAYIEFDSDANAVEYEIKYATDKKFKKNVKEKWVDDTEVTISKLKKGKTYYFKVRGANSENIVGDWSKVVKVKIKK